MRWPAPATNICGLSDEEEAFPRGVVLSLGCHSRNKLVDAQLLSQSWTTACLGGGQKRCAMSTNMYNGTAHTGVVDRLLCIIPSR